MPRLAALLAGLLAPLSLAACGDDRVVAVGGGPASDAAAAADVTGPDAAPVPRDRELIVLHDTSTPLALRVTESVPLRAKLVDYARGGPAADATVTFRIVSGSDSGGSGSLTAEQVYTDAAGLASVTFRSGAAADRAYTIEVSAPEADPVRFDVFVSDAPRGSVKVRLGYEGAVELGTIHVRLIPGLYSCGSLNVVNPPDDVVADKTLLGLGAGEVVWHNLPDAQRFTVFATAQSRQGRLAASGCLDGVAVLAGQENTVTLPLFLLSLNATGVYESTSIFDFTGAIPGTVGDVIDEISLLFNSPGGFLIVQIKRLASLYVGELITNAVFGLFEDAVVEAVDDWMFNSSPPWVRNILTVGQDLMQIVNRLELLATLTLNKLTSAYTVQGSLRWHGLALTWRYGCAREGQPGYDPSCGRREFSMTDIENTAFPLNLVEGRFNASIQDFDRLVIDNHIVRLNYGRLVIFVLNELILETLTGHDNLGDAVRSFIDCAALADRIYFGSLSTIGVDESDIEGFCDGAVDVIITPLTLVLESLAVETALRLSGTAVLEDLDDDLRVDRVVNGQFRGNFESDGRAGDPFTGTWQAERATSGR